MRKRIILIISPLFLLFACNDQEVANPPASSPSNDISVSASQPETQPESQPEDPLRELQEQGRLPNTGEGAKPRVLMGNPAIVSDVPHDSLNVFPPDYDPDRDNVPSVPIPGHPEIRLDNCPNAFNPTQEDSNGNGVGDACENM